MSRASIDKRYRRLTGPDGKVYEASGSDHLSVCERGFVWLHTRHVDVILNGKPTLYRHDGAGNLIMDGNLATVKVKLERGYTRFEHIEAWRLRSKDFPASVADADACMASLLKAIEEAEAWRKKDGQRTPQADKTGPGMKNHNDFSPSREKPTPGGVH